MLPLQVVRCFEDDDVIHVAGKVDPVADIDVINFELALADIAQLEKRLERLVKGRVKSREEEASQQVRPQRRAAMPLHPPATALSPASHFLDASCVAMNALLRQHRSRRRR